MRCENLRSLNRWRGAAMRDTDHAAVSSPSPLRTREVKGVCLLAVLLPLLRSVVQTLSWPSFSVAPLRLIHLGPARLTRGARFAAIRNIFRPAPLDWLTGTPRALG
jgi:hypothetical protein